MLPQVRPCCALSQLQAAISPEAGAGAIVAGMTPAVSGTGRGTLTRIGRAALVPWWTAQLLTGTKSFERNARDRQPTAQPARAARGAGTARARGRAKRRRRRLEHLVSAADRADFARDGFVDQARFSAAGRHSPRCCDQVEAYRGPLREIAEGDTIMRKIALDPRTLSGAAGARRACCARRNGAG